MRTPRKHEGIIFITAIVALVVMLLIGTMFMGLAAQQLRDAHRDLSALHATAMADGGLNYAISRQRNSSTRISNIYSATQIPNVRELSPTGTLAPQFVSPSTVEADGDRFAVWLSTLEVNGKVVGYQVISKGQYRKYDRSVRAVLQAARPSDPNILPPDIPNYSVFTRSGLEIGTSTNVNGPIGSNGAITINTSNGGGIKGDIYTPGGVIVTKQNTDYSTIGTVTYGTGIFDSRGRNITGTAGNIFSGATLNSSGSTQPLPAMQPDLYKALAEDYGMDAFFNSSKLSNPDLVTTPVLYVNSNNVSGYTLDLSANLNGPLVIFVNGDVKLAGNTTLGTKSETFTDANGNGKYDEGETFTDANGNGSWDEGKPIALISTGNITCQGTVVINGVVWANGSFGGGTPTVNGKILCDNLAKFQGNVQLNYLPWTGGDVVPPSTDDEWKIASWEIL